ncbi:MAG: cell division protein SepF [Xenococcaceae cyanobacterium]
MWNKLKNFVNFVEPEDENGEYEEFSPSEIAGEEFYDREEPTSIEQERINNYRREHRVQSTQKVETKMDSHQKSKVIDMPIAGGISEVIVIEPHSFEEMPQVIQALRERKSVVLNLNIMEPEEAQRAVDFVAGGTYAMDGHQERVGESIFLFTPSCVKVSTLSGILHDVQEAASHHNVRQVSFENRESDQIRMAQ